MSRHSSLDRFMNASSTRQCVDGTTSWDHAPDDAVRLIGAGSDSFYIESRPPQSLYAAETFTSHAAAGGTRAMHLLPGSSWPRTPDFPCPLSYYSHAPFAHAGPELDSEGSSQIIKLLVNPNNKLLKPYSTTSPSCMRSP